MSVLKPFLASMALGAIVVLSVGRAQEPASQYSQSTDTAQKAKILHSEKWREARYWWNEWLSVQEIYNKEQIEEIKEKMRQKIAKMSASELEDFLFQMERKLKILLSPEARDARLWLGQFLSVQAMYDDEEIKRRLPDVVNMSATQLEEELRGFEAQRAQTQQVQTEFNRGRQQQVQATEQTLKAQSQAVERATDRAYSSANRSPSGPYVVPQGRYYGPYGRGYGGYGGYGPGYSPYGRYHNGYRWW